ncbi:MAG: hypothetical protein AB7F87_07305 [Oligoflexales bacterium]
MKSNGPPYEIVAYSQQGGGLKAPATVSSMSGVKGKCKIGLLRA